MKMGRWIILSFLIVITVAITAVLAQTNSSQSGISQPIRFNHKLHIEKAGFECAECHKQVKDNTRAGIPNIGVCSMCHSSPIGNSNEEKKVVEYVQKNKRIPWLSIYHVPDYVYFSHRRHVGIAHLQCSICHGDMASLTAPPQKQFLKIKMQDCINCHEKYKADTDCYACHR